MTMLDAKCDVCLVNKAIGVASTSVPFSCAFCKECAAKGADPEWIFEYLFNEVKGDALQIRDDMVTFKDGKYVSFQEWAEQKKQI